MAFGTFHPFLPSAAENFMFLAIAVAGFACFAALGAVRGAIVYAAGTQGGISALFRIAGHLVATAYLTLVAGHLYVASLFSLG